MPNQPDQMVIRLYFDSTICLTTDEYDELIRELEIKKMTGTLTKGDGILAHVLHYVYPRYSEIMSIRQRQKEREECERNVMNGHGHCKHTPEDHERLGWSCDFWPVGGPCCKSFQKKSSLDQPREMGTPMQEVTEFILDQMQTNGWWSGGLNNRVRRFDRPTAWDINTGWCEEWVEEAQKRFGGEGLWFDQILQQDSLDCDAPSHMVLFLNGLYYDSQTPHGVSTIQEMDVFKGVSREDFLEQTTLPVQGG